MSCRKCGRRCRGRLCRDCEIEERAEERARWDTERARRDREDDDDDEGEDPVPLPDGGVEQSVTLAELERRARSAGTAYLAYCRRANVDPNDLLEEIRAEMPCGDARADGGHVVHPADAALTHRGIGDQSEPTCPNGSVECAKPGTAPCPDCFLGGGDGDA